MDVCAQTSYPVKSYNYNYDQNNSTNMSPFLAQAFDHFENHSALWELDPNVTNFNPNMGFTIRPKGDYQFQISFKRFASPSGRCNIIIDPDSLITDALSMIDGNDELLPTTAGPAAFRSTNSLRFDESSAVFVGNSMWIIELEDAIFLMNKVSDNRSYWGCHVGRVFTPILENAPSYGVTGLGVLGNQIGRTDAISFGVRSGIAPDLYIRNNGSRRRGMFRNDIQHGDTGIIFRSVDSGGDNSGSASSNALTIDDRRQMIWYYVSTSGTSSNTNTQTPLGWAKYFHPWPYQIAGARIIRNLAGTQDFLAQDPMTGSPSTMGLAIPWESGVPMFINEEDE
jgi:hypothetical protein